MLGRSDGQIEKEFKLSVYMGFFMFIVFFIGGNCDVGCLTIRGYLLLCALKNASLSSNLCTLY